MAYLITRSDGVTTHVVPDQTIDETYSSPLIGQAAPNYGQSRAQDTLRTLENFAFTTPPGGAIKGQLWFDTNTDDLKYYNGEDPGVDDSTDSALWSSVSGLSADGLDSDLLPKDGFSINLGSATRRFHTIYGIHGNFSTQGHGSVDAVPAMTIDGDSVYSSSSTLQPELTATSTLGTNLGLEDKRWRNVYTRDASVSNQLSFEHPTSTNVARLSVEPNIADTIIGEGEAGDSVTLGTFDQPFSLWANDIAAVKLSLGPGGVISSLTPEINNTYSLGSFPGQQFLNIYAQEIFENGIPLDTKYGGIPDIELGELQDVDLSALQDGQFIAYNQISGNWENVTFSLSGSHSALSDLGNDDHPQYLNETRADALYDRIDAFTVNHEQFISESPFGGGVGIRNTDPLAPVNTAAFSLTSEIYETAPPNNQTDAYFSLRSQTDDFNTFQNEILAATHNATGLILVEDLSVIGGDAWVGNDIVAFGSSGDLFDIQGKIYADEFFAQGKKAAVRFYDPDDPDSDPSYTYTTEAGGSIFVIRSLGVGYAGITPNPGVESGEMIICRHANSPDPCVQLFHGGSQRLRTTSEGIAVLNGGSGTPTYDQTATILANMLKLYGIAAQIRMYDSDDGGDAGVPNARIFVTDVGNSTGGSIWTVRGMTDAEGFLDPQIMVKHNNSLAGGQPDGYVRLAHSGIVKLQTLANGITIWGSYQTSSDERLKENIKPLKGTLAALKDINGIYFDYKHDEENPFPEERQIGLIAQEVEEHFPEIVFEQNDGMKTLAYERMTAVLVEALKEATTRIEALEAKVAKLSKK